MTWEEVEARYDDPRAHDAYIMSCRALGTLGDAAKRYRAVIENRPGDGVATERLRQVELQAVLAVTAGGADPEEAQRRRTTRIFLRAVPLAGLAGAALCIWTLGGSSINPALCEGLLKGSIACYAALAWDVLLAALVGGALGAAGGVLIGATLAYLRTR